MKRKHRDDGQGTKVIEPNQPLPRVPHASPRPANARECLAAPANWEAPAIIVAILNTWVWRLPR
ncbi:MAG: hypothetical protein NVS4B10_00280 [Myxococcales bacterium]